MTCSQLAGPLHDRAIDEIDLVITEAMLMHAFGPVTGLTITERGPGSVTFTYTDRARDMLAAMCLSSDPELADDWLELATLGLVEDVVGVLGEAWRAEAEVAVELLAAERFCDAGALAALTRRRPVTADVTRAAAQLIADRACSIELLALV